MNDKKEEMDFFDEWFQRLEQEDSIFSKSVAQFGSQIKKDIEETVHQSGYDSLSDFMNDRIYQFGQHIENQYVQRHTSQKYKTYDSRYEMVKNMLEKPQGLRFHPEIRQGYQDALQHACQFIEDRPKDLLYVERRLTQELQQLVVRKHDRYLQGYREGLKRAVTALQKSKTYMMNKVRISLYSR